MLEYSLVDVDGVCVEADAVGFVVVDLQGVLLQEADADGPAGVVLDDLEEELGVGIGEFLGVEEWVGVGSGVWEQADGVVTNDSEIGE